MKKAVVATVKSFNIARAMKLKEQFAREWDITVISDKAGLSPERLAEIAPRYIFLPHWSWLLPESIYASYECVAFHMTDLPFGRGGSPLQNLLSRGIYKTRISALKAGKGADTGPVYFKRDFDISSGSANEILDRASGLIFGAMIPEFLSGAEPQARQQEGEAVCFPRRKPQDSDILSSGAKDARAVYDFIRMLDGEGYPAAFVSVGGMRLELRNAKIDGDRVTGSFEVRKNESE